MPEMKTISPSEYVALLNEQVAAVQPGTQSPPINAEVRGTGLEERTHLHIPQPALHATALAVFELRQRGIFCFPVLAPLDDHFLV